jgi:sulfate adenylyltransferase subunit 1
LVKAVVKQIEYKLDVNTLQQQPVEGVVKLNEVVKATIKTASPLVYDGYETLSENGSAILIDETSNSTVAAVLIKQ